MFAQTSYWPWCVLVVADAGMHVRVPFALHCCNTFVVDCVGVIAHCCPQGDSDESMDSPPVHRRVPAERAGDSQRQQGCFVRVSFRVRLP